MWHFRIWRNSWPWAAAEIDPGGMLVFSKFPDIRISIYVTEYIAILTFLHANAFL